MGIFDTILGVGIGDESRLIGAGDVLIRGQAAGTESEAIRLLGRCRPTLMN